MRRSHRLLLAVVLAACTPASRIKKNQALFDSFPKEYQTAVSEGRVEPGMSPEMVRLAFGAPDRVYTRKTSEKTQEIWIWGYNQTAPGVAMAVVPYYDPYAGGTVVTGVGDTTQFVETEHVVFEGGKVLQVQTIKR